jgi:hypothetical protein
LETTDRVIGAGISRLSPPERESRARIASRERWKQDATADRRAFTELRAEREFREAAQRLVAARRDQGLPDQVVDSGTLARIATLISEPVP